MAMTIELSESQMPRPLPLPTFSAPFAAPSLRWACKKRLRCFNPDAAAAALRLPYSPDCRRPPARQFDPAKPLQCAAAANSRSLSVPPRSPPSSDRTTSPIRIPASRGEEDVREEPPDLSSGARDVGGLRSGGEAVGWSLRSRMRCGDEMGSEKRTTKKRKVELWVSLSRDEVEGDFLSMTGSKPPRRPRRGGSRTASNHLLQVRAYPFLRAPNLLQLPRFCLLWFLVCLCRRNPVVFCRRGSSRARACRPSSPPIDTRSPRIQIPERGNKDDGNDRSLGLAGG